MYLGPILNNFFDHIFIITLPHSKDRHEAMTSEMEKHHISFSFVEGVNGKLLDLDELECQKIVDWDLNLSRTGMRLTLGELGCSLSVRKICKKVVDENLQQVLILQDDVRVIWENSDFASKLLSNVPTDWDLLYLGHSPNCMKISWKIQLKSYTLDAWRYWLNSKKYINPSLIRNSYRRVQNNYWYKAGAHNGGYAYGISLKGATKLLEAFSPVFAPDDLTFNFLVRQNILNAFSPKYFLIDQRWDLGSEIGSRPSW